MLVLMTEPLARLALHFRHMSYFGLGILGLSVIASLTGKSLLKGMAAAILGIDDLDHRLPIRCRASSRFTFGSPDLLEGIAPHLRHGRPLRASPS